MASLGIRCGGNNVLDRRCLLDIRNLSNQNGRTVSMAIPNGIGCKGRGVSVSMAMTKIEPREKLGKGGNSKDVIANEKLDQWMRNSVVDIVKNLQEAPLFVQVYSNDSGESARLETEKAVAEENWPSLKRKWESGEVPMPEGIIFVEKIEEDEDEEGNNESEEEVSRAWGIVVQGRGAECGGPACYLLRTSRAAAGSGLGLWCTHFCLVKVKSFRETAKSQLKNCWLLQSQ